MGFPKRYDGELRETLFRSQGSQVSMCMAMGSASLLSSHGRGIGIQDALKEDFRGLSPVASGNPVFQRGLRFHSVIVSLMILIKSTSK